MTRDYGELLVGASSKEAQLILSLLVWPQGAPDPRLVDEWIQEQRSGLGRASAQA
jgi:hypothetical protein